MNLFWQKTVHDWWRVITDRGDVFGRPTFDKDEVSFASDNCKLHTTIQRDESGLTCRVDTVTNASDKPLHLNCLNVRFVLDGGEYEVYTQYNAWQNESLGTWHPVVTEVTASSESFRTCFGATPFFGGLE